MNGLKGKQGYSWEKWRKEGATAFQFFGSKTNEPSGMAFSIAINNRHFSWDHQHLPLEVLPNLAGTFHCGNAKLFYEFLAANLFYCMQSTDCNDTETVLLYAGLQPLHTCQ